MSNHRRLVGRQQILVFRPPREFLEFISASQELEPEPFDSAVTGQPAEANGFGDIKGSRLHGAFGKSEFPRDLSLI